MPCTQAAPIHSKRVSTRRRGFTVEVLACVADPRDCRWEDFVDLTGGTLSAAVSDALCSEYELIVRGQNDAWFYFMLSGSVFYRFTL